MLSCKKASAKFDARPVSRFMIEVLMNNASRGQRREESKNYLLPIRFNDKMESVKSFKSLNKVDRGSLKF